MNNVNSLSFLNVSTNKLILLFKLNWKLKQVEKGSIFRNIITINIEKILRKVNKNTKSEY